MGKRADRKEECIQRLAGYVLDVGLSETSLRQLAQAANVSDRMLLYYFKNKSEIMTAVLMRSASDMAEALNAALPATRPLPPGALLAKGAELTNSDAMRPYMRLSTDIAAYAGRGKEPYTSVANAIIEGFINWIEQRLDTVDPKKKKAQAAMLLAIIDGFGVLSAGVQKPVIDNALNEIVIALS